MRVLSLLFVRLWPIAVWMLLALLCWGDRLSRAAQVVAMRRGHYLQTPHGYLIDQLIRGSDIDRAHASKWLGDYPEDAKYSVIPLASALRDPNRAVKFASAASLGKLGPAAKAAVPALIELLQDDESRARVAGASALARIGPDAKPAVPWLAHAMESWNADLRAAAAPALGNCSDGSEPEVVPALVLGLSDWFPEVRCASARALANMKSNAAPAAPALIASLLDKSHQVRRAVRDALLNGASKEHLAAAAMFLRRQPVQKNAILQADIDVTFVALSRDPALAPKAIEVLGDRGLPSDIRVDAARTLGRLRPTNATILTALRRMLWEEGMQIAAADALAEIGPSAREALPELERIAKLRATLEVADSAEAAIRRIAKAPAR